MIEWKAVQLPLGQLENYQNNPRRITKEKFDSLKASLDELGIFKPLTVDFDQVTVIGGNQRQRALLQKFPKDYMINCMVPDRALSLEEREKVIVVDNGHHGEWDMDILSSFTIDINDLDLDIKVPEIKIASDEDYSDKNKEIDLDNFGNDLQHTCPSCGFQFNE